MNYKEVNLEILNEQDLTSTSEFSIMGKDGQQIDLKIANSDAGYEQLISTLAHLQPEIIDQKVYGENFSEFARVTQEAGYADSIVFTVEEAIGSADGSSSSDGSGAKGGNVTFERKQLAVKFHEWSEGYEVGHSEQKQAETAQGRSALMSKERSLESTQKQFMNRKFFVGEGVGATKHRGLLDMEGVTTDVTTIPTKFSLMTKAQLESVFSAMYEAFQVNNFYTADADTLVMSKQEMTRLSRVYSEFGINTVNTLIRTLFAELTGNANFKVVSTLYAEAARSPLGKNMFMLYNSSTVRWDVPVEVKFINTLGSVVKAEKILRTSEVFAERRQEVLVFTPADE